MSSSRYTGSRNRVDLIQTSKNALNAGGLPAVVHEPALARSSLPLRKTFMSYLEIITESKYTDASFACFSDRSKPEKINDQDSLCMMEIEKRGNLEEKVGWGGEGESERRQ